MYENGSLDSIDKTAIGGSLSDDFEVTGDGLRGPSADVDNFLPSDSVSASDPLMDYRLVSASYIESDIDSSVQLLQAIDYKLSIVLFFLLASWTFARIRNAVRSFTGRSVDVSERR